MQFLNLDNFLVLHILRTKKFKKKLLFLKSHMNYFFNRFIYKFDILRTKNMIIDFKIYISKLESDTNLIFFSKSEFYSNTPCLIQNRNQNQNYNNTLTPKCI